MQIEVYGRPMCDGCEAALYILESNGIPYQYYNIEQMLPEQLRYLITERAPGAKEVPIIFIDGRRISGINELKQYFEDSITDVVEPNRIY